MKRNALPWMLALPVLVTPALALAQSETFALNRYNPSERGSDWFANESLDLRGHVRPAIGIVGDWSYKPLVLYDTSGDEIEAIVRHQVFAHLGGALVLWDRLRLGVNLPLLVYNKGATATVAGATFSSEDATTLGDLRLGADVRLLGAYEEAFTLAVGAQLFLPTGNEAAYASDGAVRVQPRLMGAGDIGSFAYAAQVGFNYRAHDGELDGVPFGSEFNFSAAAGLRLLDKKLLIGPELIGSTVVSDGDAVFARRSTPLELLFGGKYRATDSVRVGAGIGPGLSRGFGSPAVRVLASLEWMPDVEKPGPAKPSDRDGDGIVDTDDACPDEPGRPHEEPQKNGCPPTDRDGDTIFDDEDACPSEPGEANEDPEKHGCPPPPSDRDGDGIVDDKDACPDEPGEANEDPQKNGCPPPGDRDGDTITDDVDGCPDEPGQASADPKKHGCPKAKIEKTEIVIFDRVEFELDSANLLPESDAVLGEVLKILQTHAEFTKVSVEGHTDSRGTDGYNQQLSQRRAATVVDWLASRGIDKKRLASKGFGESRPVDTNDTEAGRQNNRRVEFHIREIDGKPAPKDTQN